jgi:hypothetical protein
MIRFVASSLNAGLKLVDLTSMMATGLLSLLRNHGRVGVGIWHRLTHKTSRSPLAVLICLRKEAALLFPAVSDLHPYYQDKLYLSMHVD